MDVVSQRKNGRGNPSLGLPRPFCCAGCHFPPPEMAPEITVDCPWTVDAQPPGAGIAQPAPGEYHPWKNTIADEYGSTQW